MPDGILDSFGILDIYEATPVRVSKYGRYIEYILRENEFYGATCGVLGMDVNYDTRHIALYAVNDENHPVDGDGLLEFTLNKDAWNRFVENLGTYENINAQLQHAQVNAATQEKLSENVKGVIRGFLGGRRKTRKMRKARKMRKQTRTRRT